MYRKQELEAVISQELSVLELELVELRFGGSRARPVLDVRIDRTDGGKVIVADCERASRAIEAKLDGSADLVDGRYVLEVSSPGAERPLRSLADWRRFRGRRAVVKSARLAAVGGRAEIEIVAAGGEEGSGGQVIIRDDKGLEYTLALAEITEARLAFHWKP